MSVLETSRIRISVIPERLVAEVAREQDVPVAVLERDPALSRAVLLEAIERWWDLIPRWKRLDFTMQHQQQTQWCWAATSVSVRLFYRPFSGWTQCRMANAEKGQTTCCTTGSSPACNQPHVLDAPLDRVDCLDRMQAGTVGYATIRAEINAGRPLAWRIGWSGGGGHFAVIEGYRINRGQWVAIDDPWYGASDVALTTLTGGTYQGTGTWTHTYFTQRPLLPFVVDDLEWVRLFPWDVLREHDVPVPGGDR